MGAPMIWPVRAKEGDTVRIFWSTSDGTLHVQEVTVPPKATREAKANAHIKSA